jgi:hypothetical protein
METGAKKDCERRQMEYIGSQPKGKMEILVENNMVKAR